MFRIPDFTSPKPNEWCQVTCSPTNENRSLFTIGNVVRNAHESASNKITN